MRILVTNYVAVLYPAVDINLKEEKGREILCGRERVLNIVVDCLLACANDRVHCLPMSLCAAVREMFLFSLASCFMVYCSKHSSGNKT